MDIRLAPAEHYDQAFERYEHAAKMGGPAATNAYLATISQCLLGLLRAEMEKR